MRKEKMIKTNIKNKMAKENMKVYDLSRKTNIGIIKLFFLLCFPVCKIKLTQTISICKALNLNVSDIV